MSEPQGTPSFVEPGAIVRVPSSISAIDHNDLAVVDRVFDYRDERWAILRAWCWPWTDDTEQTEYVTLRAEILIVEFPAPERTVS